jgi:hypothetical protein
MKVNYYRDIHPIFDAVCRNSWVNKMGFMGHGSDKPGNFLNPDLETKLSTPPSGQVDDYENMRFVHPLSKILVYLFFTQDSIVNKQEKCFISCPYTS